MHKRTFLSRTSCFLLASTVVGVAHANHGPGTAGGGVSTMSAETLRTGKWEMLLRTDYTGYASVSQAEAEAAAIEHHHFDALDSSLVTTLGVGYGLSDDLELGATIGWYSGSGFKETHAHDEDGDGTIDTIETAQADPAGLTDLWLTAKWRVMRAPEGQLALLGGIKLPVGDDSETLDNGERLEPSSQPGTGEFDFIAGAAYSRFLDERLVFDASAAWTIRGKGDDFKVGDRIDAGIALSYRITADVQSFPNWSVSAEVLDVWLGHDEEDEGAGFETVESSGGNTLYGSVGARVRFNEGLSLSLAPALPLSQDLHGSQAETDLKLLLSLNWSL